MKGLRCSLLLIFLVLLSFDFRATRAEVITLTADTFTDKVKEKDVKWFVKFCVPWCKHCKNLGSLWEDLGSAMEGEDEIEIGQVDCSASKPVCNNVDIHSYPTFKLFYDGEEVVKYQVNFLTAFGCKAQGIWSHLNHLFWTKQRRREQKCNLTVVETCDDLQF